LDDAARVRALHDAKATLDEARAKADEQRKVLELELELRFENELGPRGEEFEIVSTTSGPVVVKRGEPVQYKRFQATMRGDKEPTPEDIYAYVSPCVVHPTKSEFDHLLNRRPHIAMRCANALISLQGFKEESDRGKF
jgi:hypothetical protein